jgi:CheY-like chemotaxis protein
MKVLLVEDDENKKSQILEYYQGQFPGDELLCEDSMVGGLRTARKERPQFVILDMTLPNYSISSGQGYNPMRPFGGRDFLRQLQRLSIGAQAVVLTQFETFGVPPDQVDLQSLNRELRKDFPELFLGSIYYHASKSSWQSELVKTRENLEG